MEAIMCILIDVQSTGASPRHGSILEVSWGELSLSSPRELIQCEHSLVQLPPSVRLTKKISALTGITKAILSKAKRPSEVAQRLWRVIIEKNEAAQGGSSWVWVAHFAHFEYAFIRALLLAHPPERLSEMEAEKLFDSRPWVCTHALCQRIFPTLPRRTLSAMNGYFGGSQLTLKRSEAHLEATAVIWRGLQEELEAQGISTWSGLVAVLQNPVKRRPFSPALPREIRLQAPRLPGVYTMYDRRGEALYIGSAQDLKQRVNQHFVGRRGHDERHLELLTLVTEVKWVSTASHLEALLLENREIKRRSPPYNRALTQTEAPLYLDLDSADLRPLDRGDFGPWVNRSTLEVIASVYPWLKGAEAVPSHPAWPEAPLSEWALLKEQLEASSALSSQKLRWRQWLSWGEMVVEEPERLVESRLSSPLFFRAGELALRLYQEYQVNRWISLLSAGELIWLASFNKSDRAWRHLELGDTNPLKSSHRSAPPRESFTLTQQDFQSFPLRRLSTRAQFDEARILYRFICRSLRSEKKVFWRPIVQTEDSTLDDQAPWYELTLQILQEDCSAESPFQDDQS